ncbi:MAG TPA: DinB family protein [Anaerolineales bacterium]|nr:DinB family protein [Anaerolineales bacterium]
MALTLLLDLDDTLLDTNIAEFVPAYFQALSRYLQPWVQPDKMLAALMAGTQRMLENTDPTLTLQQAFDAQFYPVVGLDNAELREAIDQFYDGDFLKLSSVTQRRPGARDLIDSALNRGCRVVIATDPLFPRKAVYERIRWAGLDARQFDLISSYETFHFTKSHPAYYAELLGRVGWPDGPVLMVGNDEERDLLRAQEFGLSTYHVISASAASHTQGPPSGGSSGAIGRGTLEDLCRWLEAGDAASLEPDLHRKQAVLAILLSSPAVLQGLAAGLGVDDWRREPTPEDWALAEIVCHMRDTEREVHMDQLRTLLDETQPFVPRPDAAVWAKQRKYLQENGEQALLEFAASRQATLASMYSLDETVWNKPARHAIFGPTNFMEVVGFMADHDRLHIQQAWRTIRAWQGGRI